ncbi:MAG: 4a-hydroxytetrahydrobiopterin dehydratase [Gammaproteobacteria bacterium]|nr:4a-hydroxytetrahydrobiopterin dehydratase [Gammaproteobacteria bacterium]
MTNLANEKIVLGKKGDAAISRDDADTLLTTINDWSIVTEECDKLTKCYKLPDYLTAVEMTRKFAAIAEQVNHHPVIMLEWGKVTVTWWTHVIGGLHKNDFIMAAKCDRAAMLVTAP